MNTHIDFENPSDEYPYRNPRLSLITVCYNSVSTIERTLKSVANQNYSFVEHIVIDGASNDGTLNILQEYQKGLAYVISESDHGIYDAMNKGIKKATGDIIGILNADDVYANQSVLSKVAIEFENPTVDAVFGDLEYFRGNNPSKVIRTYRSKNFSSKKIALGIMPAHPTLFLRRSVYEKFGLFDRTYKIGGDFEFIARIFKDGMLNFRYLPEVMVKMQIGGASTNGLFSNIVLLQENFRACRQNGIATNYLKLILRYPKKLLEYFHHY